eukprot:CAMPEP_0114246330 /NCGR_PEP_ID=MMETSP0058-20121206/12400_1 /TAXON_ID=36894 /ORGANISM="Pyramimonas parkeae, CCMP726" /LENGTH=131 /DNA_ID=CAMNT_0001359499 /DNA_START=459 /DNA_END=854 /DNA_ORIENTATION=+
MERVFTQADVEQYARLGGDSNPIHLDPQVAQAAGLEGCVVHGMLYAGLFPAIIAARQPGAIYLKQDLRFRHPVPVGATVRAQVAVIRVSSNRVVLETKCHLLRSNGDPAILVLDGEALALLPTDTVDGRNA